MPNVQTRHKFQSDLAYVSEMRRAWVENESAFRAAYFELVKEIEDLAWTERLLREKVLLWDDSCRDSCLRGSRLTEYLDRREDR